MSRFALNVLLVAFLSLSPVWATGEEKNACRLATFQSDVTPPLNSHPLIWIDPVKTVEDPLAAKGVVLECDGQRVVLCSVDWCGLCNGSHRLFAGKIAAAAEVPLSQVALHCIHQHTAPYTDGDAQELLNATENPPKYVDAAFVEQVSDRLAAAVREACGRWEPFDQVGIGVGRVEQVAATRRVKTEDGKIRVRYSACKDPGLRAMPEGNIDPVLKTITLARAGKPLVRMHYYAVHPQSFYGDARVSADFPGHAREALQRKEGVFQIYFTGCAGDVTAGKYNDGAPEARTRLTQRLSAGMEAAVAGTKLAPVGQCRWDATEVSLPPRTDPPWNEPESLKKIGNTALPGAVRARAACCVASARRADRPYAVAALTLGPATILHLPSECLIEYQHYAQRSRSDRFVAVAAYGDLGPGYVCPASAFEEGGYEPTASHVAPASEAILKAAIDRVLGSEKANPGDKKP